MKFRLKGAGSAKWIKVTDKLWRNENGVPEERTHDARALAVGAIEEWSVRSSDANIESGWVTIEVARTESGRYVPHHQAFTVDAAEPFYLIDDARLPLKKKSAKADAAEAYAAPGPRV